MDMLEPIKRIIKKGKEKADLIAKQFELDRRLQLLKDEFDLAEQEKIPWNNKFDKEEQIYNGDREFGNIFSDQTKDDSRTPVRVSQTMIEAQVDLTIPDAVFKPVSQDDELVVKQLQAEVDYSIRSCNTREINSFAEREVKKHGMCVYKVLWNHKYRGAGYTGKAEYIRIHPKNVLWAAGTTDKDYCRAYYIVDDMTLSECIIKYGEIAKQLPEKGLLSDMSYSTVGTGYESGVNKTIEVKQNIGNNRPSDHPLTKYTIIEKWYLDEDDECGLVVFSDNLMLLDKPKFYHRRKYDAENEEFVLDEDGREVMLEDEEIEEDYNTKANDASGNLIYYTRVPKGTRVPYYYPTGVDSLPIVIQNNIPRSKGVCGISDIERTYDMEQSMKKMLHKYEECMLRGNAKIFYNKNLEEEAALMLDNEDLNIIPVNDVNNIQVKDLSYNNRAALEFFQFLLEHLQYSLGVTSVWQGINKSESTSGKMTEALINQTAEKISIKTNEKNIAYRKIYRLMCNFILAFSDGDRPYRLDRKLQSDYGTFNRLSMLRRVDSSGNYAYADWDIEISAETALSRNKSAIINSIIQMAQYGMLEPSMKNITAWTILAKQSFPAADVVLEMITAQTEQLMQQQQAMQAQAMGQQQAAQQQSVEMEQAKMEQEAKEKEADRAVKNPQQQDTSKSDAMMKMILAKLPPDKAEMFLNMPDEEKAALLQGAVNEE